MVRVGLQDGSRVVFRMGEDSRDLGVSEETLSPTLAERMFTPLTPTLWALDLVLEFGNSLPRWDLPLPEEVSGGFPRVMVHPWVSSKE